MYPNFPDNFIFLLIIVIWSLFWKGYSLWLAAKHNHRKWFIALLIFNTIGILEIFYVFNIVKKSFSDVKKDFHKAFSSIK